MLSKTSGAARSRACPGEVSHPARPTANSKEIVDFRGTCPPSSVGSGLEGHSLGSRDKASFPFRPAVLSFHVPEDVVLHAIDDRGRPALTDGAHTPELPVAEGPGQLFHQLSEVSGFRRRPRPPA